MEKPRARRVFFFPGSRVRRDVRGAAARPRCALAGEWEHRPSPKAVRLDFRPAGRIRLVA